MGNVRSARRADNGQDCRDQAQAPTIARVGWVGESFGSSGGRCVGGPRRRGVSSRPSLQCGAQPGAGATSRLRGLAPCASCLGGSGWTSVKSSVFTAVLGRLGALGRVAGVAAAAAAVADSAGPQRRLTATRHASAAGAVRAACDVQAARHRQ